MSPVLLALVLLQGAASGTAREKPPAPLTFTIEKQLDRTPVKDQAETGTCWSFSTTSFIESELIRMGRGPLDLSEMFTVRHAYLEKARRYVHLKGKITFGSGGLSGDVMRSVARHGMVPESVYSGGRAKGEPHDHAEMDRVLKAMVDAVIARKKGAPTEAWPKAFEGVLDAYLGKVPESFEYKGRTCTPRSFAQELGFDPADYVELTSYTHHPFYTRFAVEVPDNWAGNVYFNVPLDEMMAVLDRSLETGYTAVWDGDATERGFLGGKGLAILPPRRWKELTDAERERFGKVVLPEMAVTQEMRQEGFDSKTSTDDHLMHIVGVARDPEGGRYYILKNSWGEKSGPHRGYLYMSDDYARAKTVSIMVHRDVLPDGLRKKLER